MIQQSMIFVLGFLVASLLSLLALPAVSHRAVRLATRRLSLLVPLSMREIHAERDQIRAENAAVARRLEQRVERLTQAKAEAMADAGRHAGARAVLVRERDALAARADSLESDLRAASRTAHDATGELGLQMQLLHDTLGLAERRLAQLNTSEARAAAGEALADTQRLTIAGLETRATGQDLKIRNLMAQLASSMSELDKQRAQAAQAAVEHTALGAELATARHERDEALARLAEAEARRPAADADLSPLRTLLGELAVRTGTPFGVALDDRDREIGRLRAAISAVGEALDRDDPVDETGSPSAAKSVAEPAPLT